MLIQNTYDDAVLLGCDEDDFKNKLRDLLLSLEFSIGKE